MAGLASQVNEISSRTAGPRLVNRARMSARGVVLADSAVDIFFQKKKRKAEFELGGYPRGQIEC